MADEEKEKPKKSSEKLITVKAGPALKPRQDGGDPVALWERNKAHPGGEAFVAGSKPVQVSTTAEVSRLLRDGVLVEVDAK